jgi:glutathione S-transferase
MLTLYHAPMSPNSRRVWIALLEKGVEFNLVEQKLDGTQFKPEYLAINPFHHVPALVDDDFNVIESLAILDYLEAKFPSPSLWPKDAKDVAIARMVQLTTVNELLPAISPLFLKMLGLPGGDLEKMREAEQKIGVVLTFFEGLLGDRPYFGSDSLTLAEVVAGTVIPWLSKADISLSQYPRLNAWCDRLVARPSWQATEAPQEELEAFKARMAARFVHQ